MTDFRTPLSKVRGFGSAVDGTGHFVKQRGSAIALAVLVLWFIVAAIRLGGLEYGATQAWLAEPYHAIMMLLFVITAFYHARLGLQTVVEDYVHHELSKMATLLAINFACIGFGLASVFSILKVALGN